MPYVNIYVKTGRRSTITVCPNMVEMTYEIPNYVEDLIYPELQAEYAMNRRHILGGDEDNELKKVYNFPSNNLHRGFNEI